MTDAWGNDLARPSVTIDPGLEPTGGWRCPSGSVENVPPGEYGVYVEIDEQVVGSLAFGITGQGSSAQSLPEAPTNVQVRATLPPPGAAPAVSATGTAGPNQQGQQGQTDQQWQDQQAQTDQQWQQVQQGQADQQWQQDLPEAPWQQGQDGQPPPGWGQEPQGLTDHLPGVRTAKSRLIQSRPDAEESVLLTSSKTPGTWDGRSRSGQGGGS